MSEQKEEDLAYIDSLIGIHNDFPIPGIVFRDIFPVFGCPKAVEMLFTRLVHHVQVRVRFCYAFYHSFGFARNNHDATEP
jgi:hypothetical protein